MTTTLIDDASETDATPAEHRELLKHYLDGAQQTVGSIDQLGNFLMGFGVLALGYLLNADLASATTALGAAEHALAGLLALGAWGSAVGLLVLFVWTYIFRVIAGRDVHAREGREDGVGDVIDLPTGLTYPEFSRHQRTFEQFLETHYLHKDRKEPSRLMFVRWSYLRFMTLKKLEAMERMRGMLGLALLFGVSFKVLMVYLKALPV